MGADRELLEQAANAIGVTEYGGIDDCRGPGVVKLNGSLVHYEGHGEFGYAWNPLDDDGDAFRLALAAHVSIEVMRDRVRVGGWQRMPSGKVSFATMTAAWGDKNDDERAALVRRMVVEAASRAVLPKDRT